MFAEKWINDLKLLKTTENGHTAEFENWKEYSSGLSDSYRSYILEKNTG